MTIESLLEKSAAELEAMTDSDLMEYFGPYLKYTRPELAEKPVNTKKYINPEMSEKAAKKEKTNAILKQLGIDLKL